MELENNRQIKPSTKWDLYGSVNLKMPRSLWRFSLLKDLFSSLFSLSPRFRFAMGWLKLYRFQFANVFTIEFIFIFGLDNYPSSSWGQHQINGIAIPPLERKYKGAFPVWRPQSRGTLANRAWISKYPERSIFESPKTRIHLAQVYLGSLRTLLSLAFGYKTEGFCCGNLFRSFSAG